VATAAGFDKRVVRRFNAELINAIRTAGAGAAAPALRRAARDGRFGGLEAGVAINPEEFTAEVDG
ncbi:hypothetical protein TIFTF001_054710, partial [Ficus carica]